MQKELKQLQLKPQPYRIWLEDNYKDLMRRLTQPYGAQFKKGEKPSEAQIAQMQEKLDKVAKDLEQPVTQQELAMFLEVLFAAFTSRNASDMQLIAGAYIVAIGEFSKYAIEKTLQDFLQGLVPEQHLTYVPSPALFATHCRKIERDYQTKINLMRKKLTLSEIC